MKFNFKKITSVLASAVMLGSTMGIAVAANYPAPFISGGAADVSIVVGAASPNNVDWAPAVEIGNALSTELSSQTSGTSSTGTTASGGDSLKLDKSTNRLNMNDAITDVWTTKVTDANLPDLLADVTFRSKDNIDYQYEQYIDFFENINFTHFDDDDYKEDTPSLGVKFASSANVLNYTLTFKKYARSDVDSNARLEDIQDRDITILGKTYKLLNAYNSSTDTKFEFMRGAVTDTINLNEEKTETVGSKSYTVTLTYVDTTYAQFDIIDSEGNSQTTTKLAKGGTYKLLDKTQIGVTDISYQSFAGGVMAAEFTLGADKLTIENGQTVEVNDVDVNGLTGYITRSEVAANQVDIQKIIIQWTTDDEEFVAEDSVLTLPAFESLKFEYGGFYTPCEETVQVKSKGTYGIELVVPIKDGDAPFSILNGDGTYFTTIADDTDGTGNLRTASNLTGDAITFDKDVDDYFIASWNDTTSAESYLLRVTSVTEDTSVSENYTTVENKVSGTSYSNKKTGDIITIGNVELTIDKIDKDNKQVTFTISTGGTFNRVYTAGGLGIYLPINCTDETLNADGCGTQTNLGANWNILLNGTGEGNESSWYLYMTEEDKDGNLGSGDIINITLGHASSEAEPTELDGGNGLSAGTYKEIGDSKEYEGYIPSDLGTRVIITKPTSGQNSVDVIYHCSESYAEIYLTAPETVVSGTGIGTELGSVTYYDNELTAAQKAKNLVVVGGSCINTVAAELLGGNLCAAEFTASTGVGADQFLVEVFDNPYTTGKIAMLVAGYEAADTAKAATYVTKETPVDTTVGTKLKKVTATYANVA